jgi:predicted transcriptional regulator
MPQSILEMAKDLVMAQVQSGALSPEDMHKELQKTYASLMELKGLEEAVATGTAAIPGLTDRGAIDEKGRPGRPLWRKSIKKSSIECMECGASFKQLSVRHLKDHGLDARSYRSKYGIPRTQPLSARDTTATRKKIIQQSKPWEKAPTYIKAHTLKSASGTTTKAARTRKKASKKAS